MNKLISLFYLFLICGYITLNRGFAEINILGFYLGEIGIILSLLYFLTKESFSLTKMSFSLSKIDKDIFFLKKSRISIRNVNLIILLIVIYSIPYFLTAQVNQNFLKNYVLVLYLLYLPIGYKLF